MEKNYLLALVLSMVILMGYPVFLKWLNPPTTADVEQNNGVSTETALVSQTQKPLTLPEGPFLEPQAKPAVVRYSNNLYDIEFSTLGGSVSRFLYKGEVEQHRLTDTLFYEGDPANPGLFGVRLWQDEGDLEQTIFKLNRRGTQNEIFEFVYEKPGEYRLIKQYTVGDQKPIIDLDVTLENISSRERHFPVELSYGIHYELTSEMTSHNYEVIVWGEKAMSANLDRVLKKGFVVSQELEWVGVAKKYFAVLIKPDWKAIGNEATADKKMIWSRLKMEPISIAPGGNANHRFLIYAGPQRYEALKSFDVGFEQILSRGFFGIFKIWFLVALKFCYRFTHNFGWAIILLTLALKGVFTPLTHMSFQSMKKMQALAPKLKALQERYKGDPTKLNKEMMELYRRNRVNPMGGCLPMVLQIPIFIAFYQVLSETIELKGAPFIGWIHDLSVPDRFLTLPFTLPVLGWDALNILPILMLASMFWQQKLTPQAGATPEQTKMMEFMPLIFGFMFYSMPSGLVLYWFVNNVLSIIHQIFVKRMVIVLHHEDRE